jgi:nitrile hydratase
MTSHHLGHGDSQGRGPGHPAHSQAANSPELGYYAKRARAIEALLVDKGICTPEEVQRTADEIDARSPADGARVVARAWVNPGFKTRLLADAAAAVAELGYTLAEPAPRLVAVENTDKVHHLVVCTLCSCYPRALLGRPPDWYKSLAYRSRAVVDPRGVLREFGLELGANAVVRVLDSTADLRYLVVPRRPAGTERLSEGELARLVTRDSMIGVGHARSPEPAVAG